jgi:epoxyqueuosine reductase
VKTEEILQRINAALAEKSIRAKLVKAVHLADLEEAIHEQERQGIFDPLFYGKELSLLNYRPPEEMRNARSMFLAAYPQPIVSIPFHYKGKKTLVTVPPHYNYSTDQIPLQTINSVIGPHGYSVRQFSALPPMKLMAVKSGLGEYGRNNIVYTKEFGSFQRLILFYSDFPVVEDEWGPVKPMEQCGNCQVCRLQCPTGAIDPDRFVIHAEKCITLINESPADFPPWFRPEKMHSLIGCLSCQEKCPANAHVKDNIKISAEFDQEETELLLGKPSVNTLPKKTRQKLEELGLQWYLPVVCRNLKILLDASC